ncbi:MAG: rhomboid family intramembrane serine protease [Kiritimatiellae bacterium]|nr:rhomboid family intramembrane serine protease [Kiritimatiellia bacterium]
MRNVTPSPGHAEAMPRLLPAVVFTAAIMLLTKVAPPIALTSTGLQAGETWRLFTHAWLHVSSYHALLDAGAFAILFAMMSNRGMHARLAITVGGILGGALTGMLDPDFGAAGLCGLSAAAHGLMAVVITDRIRARYHKRLSTAPECIAMGILLAKCGLEAMTGGTILTPFHIGNIGRPNATCHIGGVIGALAIAEAIRYARAHLRSHAPSRSTPHSSTPFE